MAANKLPTSTANSDAAPLELFTDEVLGVAADEEELPLDDTELSLDEEGEDVADISEVLEG